MPGTHARDFSPDYIDPVKHLKRCKTSADDDMPSTSSSSSSSFVPNLFDHHSIATLSHSYHTNSPFKHAVLDKLFQDDLLANVKDECLNLSFTEKQTDIYKIHQTGDLASINYITQQEREQLSNLLTLRDALYSAQFRDFLRAVTGCGPLSGIKRDMSVASYQRGCHLLNHDDVISSRRVSYILYMPTSPRQTWQREWGGSLELYPVIKAEDGSLVPDVAPSKVIPPKWNQFVLFEVQPGRSFHSVEEVIVGGEGDNRNRLSISGWFHAAQPGEEGYVPEPISTYKSSREQLQSNSINFKHYPPADKDALALATTLSDDHTAFLSEFLNPVYLQPRTMQALSSRFVEESSLELHQFLNAPLSQALQPRLRELDAKDGLGPDRLFAIPSHTAGATSPVPTSSNDHTSYFGPRPLSHGRTKTPPTNIACPNSNWTVRGPPHKWRYCTLSPKPQHKLEAVTPRSAHASSDEIMRSLQDELFSSGAFRAWLAIVAGLVPIGYTCEARRFRPGLDYTLATSEAVEARLDVVLGLTPEVFDAKGSRGHSSKDTKWRGSEWGGWECYLAPHNEDDDPTVYKSGNTGQRRNDNIRQHPSTSNPDQMDVEDEAEICDDDDDDSTLLTVYPGFNRLLLVLRDEKVMRFVKYVSASAEGSRWDVCAEYEVGALQPDSDGDDA